MVCRAVNRHRLRLGCDPFQVDHRIASFIYQIWFYLLIIVPLKLSAAFGAEIDVDNILRIKTYDVFGRVSDAEHPVFVHGDLDSGIRSRVVHKSKSTTSLTAELTHNSHLVFRARAGTRG